MAQREEKVCFGLIEFISTKLRSHEMYLFSPFNWTQIIV